MNLSSVVYSLFSTIDWPLALHSYPIHDEFDQMNILRFKQLQLLPKNAPVLPALRYDFDKPNCLGALSWHTVSDPQPAGGITYPIWSGSTSGSPPAKLDDVAGAAQLTLLPTQLRAGWAASAELKDCQVPQRDSVSARVDVVEWSCWRMLQELRHNAAAQFSRHKYWNYCIFRQHFLKVMYLPKAVM